MWRYFKMPILGSESQEMFVHDMNDRHGGSNMHKGRGTCPVGAHYKTMTASSIMDIAGTWCNKFCKEQLKATLKDVQYNPKSNFNLFSIGKAIKEGWKLSGDKEQRAMKSLSLTLRLWPKME